MLCDVRFSDLLDPWWPSEEGRMSRVFWEGHQVSASWCVLPQSINSTLAPPSFQSLQRQTWPCLPTFAAQSGCLDVCAAGAWGNVPIAGGRRACFISRLTISAHRYVWCSSSSTVAFSVFLHQLASSAHLLCHPATDASSFLSSPRCLLLCWHPFPNSWPPFSPVQESASLQSVRNAVSGTHARSVPNESVFLLLSNWEAQDFIRRVNLTQFCSCVGCEMRQVVLEEGPPPWNCYLFGRTHWMVPVGTVDFCPRVSLTLSTKLLLFLVSLEERLCCGSLRAPTKGRGRAGVDSRSFSKTDLTGANLLWVTEPVSLIQGGQWLFWSQQSDSFTWNLSGWVWNSYFGCVLNSIGPSVKVVTRPATSCRSRGSFSSSHLKNYWSDTTRSVLAS